MVTRYQKAISGNDYKNDGATVLKAGAASTSVGNPVTNVRTLRDNAIYDGYGSKVMLAVSPTSSGTIGTFSALSGGTFARRATAGAYLGIKLTNTINGTANTTLKMGAADFGTKRTPHPLTTCRLLDEDSWDAETGDVTKGGNQGVLSSFGLDHAANSSNAVPGELTVKTGAFLPTNLDYKPRTSN